MSSALLQRHRNQGTSLSYSLFMLLMIKLMAYTFGNIFIQFHKGILDVFALLKQIIQKAYSLILLFSEEHKLLKTFATVSSEIHLLIRDD